jgi:hypothetical protein
LPRRDPLACSPARDADGLVAEIDCVAMLQLPAAARFDRPVDADGAVGDHTLCVGTAVDQTGVLQELAEPDRLVPDRHVAGLLRHQVRLAP